MRKKRNKTFFAICMSLAMVVTSIGSTIAVSVQSSAATDDNASLTKVLSAKDIGDLRFNWDDTSNIGPVREVIIAGRSEQGTLKVKDNGLMRKELTSKELAQNEMGTGINLGNTMEGTLSMTDKETCTDPTKFELSWRGVGAKITTQKYIDTVHSYGINTIRIPVAWSNMVKDNDPTYTIDEKYLGRVEEIVNYALNDGMYVIINDHWDSQWWGQFGACKIVDGKKVANQEVRDAAWARYESYWKQISERFKNYSDHLIFEGANEELGSRLNDPICSNGYVASKDAKEVGLGGNLTEDQCYTTVNAINQKFVDVVRATGGNNAYRHLLIPGYDTDITATVDKRFIMPTDTKENGTSKLFLSVHYYTPSDFCLGSGDYTVKEQKDLKTNFAKLTKFSDYGIIIGECGVCEPYKVASSVTQWMYDAFTEAKKVAAVPCLWDTGSYFDRENAKINFKDIAIFYNTINNAKGDTSVKTISGGDPNSVTERVVGKYINKDTWEKRDAIHAYLFYQTSTWDYRNIFAARSEMGPTDRSWEYIQAAGKDVPATTVVKDILVNKDGEYTVSIDGINLSGAVKFQMLGISTDLSRINYPDSNIKVTNATIKFDGKTIKDNVDLGIKGDEKYYNFMAVNVYEKDTSVSLPLKDENQDQKLVLPSNKIEITFKISGLSKVEKDIANASYIDPETKKTLSGIDPIIGLEKNKTFASGFYNYKVTTAATSSKDGVVQLIDLNQNGLKSKFLSVPTTIKNSGVNYNVTSIGPNVFKSAKAISITLNKYITTIPSSAFNNCENLSTLTVNAKLSKVAKDAFKGCKQIIVVKGPSNDICKANILKLKTSGYKNFK